MIRWRIAERFHWTLPEVDALSMQDLHDLEQIDHGRSKAAEDEATLKNPKRKV